MNLLGEVACNPPLTRHLTHHLVVLPPAELDDASYCCWKLKSGQSEHVCLSVLEEQGWQHGNTQDVSADIMVQVIGAKEEADLGLADVVLELAGSKEESVLVLALAGFQHTLV